MISYIRGYYTLTIEGIGTEKFLNYLIVNKVRVYNVKRINDTKLEINIDRKDMRKFKKAYRGSNYKIVIKNKTGLTFLAFRIYKRKVMWIGALISLAILMLTTQFVTDVYIDAPEGIDKDAVMQELYEIGLKPGTYKQSIDRKEIREYIISQFSDIAYVSINVEGTNIFVTITKKSESLDSNENSNYCNIIASKNGIIEEVITRSGNALVEPGNVVTEGSVLINGANTQALPEVWANTFYEVTKSKSYEDVLIEETGKDKNVYTIMFYDEDYTIRRNIDYETYTIENKEYKITIGDYTFPISINVSKFLETEETKIEIDQEKLKTELQEEALAELEYIIPVSARYVDIQDTFKVEGNMLHYTVTVQTLEDIAKVYNLSNVEIQQMIQEEEKEIEENGELQQQNEQKRPINDIRNQIDIEEDATEEKEENNN